MARSDEGDRPPTESEQLSSDALRVYVLSNLTLVDEDALRRTHAYVLGRLRRSGGPWVMAIGAALSRLEAEMRRPGMEADYHASHEHNLRSSLAYAEGRRCYCDATEDSKLAADLDREIDSIRSELRRLCDAGVEGT